MPRKLSLDNIVYWGTFIFAATIMAYLLVTLINLSVEEDTAFLGQTNYRQQVRVATVVTTEGKFQVLLMRSQSPLTTRNFLRLAQSGFYGGATFRTFDQGIVAEVNVKESDKANPLRTFDDDSSRLPMTRGLVVMLKNKDSKVDATQLVFFVKDDFAPAQGIEYVTLGSVSEGMDVVDKVNSLSPAVDENAKPSVAILDITTD